MIHNQETVMLTLHLSKIYSGNKRLLHHQLFYPLNTKRCEYQSKLHLSPFSPLLA